MAGRSDGPDAPYRRDGGRLGLPDGARLFWSMAEGRRGRRWRAVASLGGAITHALLLEVDLAGRPSRLELTTPAGLLTLHPEPDERSIHGNVVSEAGVRPLAFAWSPDHELDVIGRPLAIACGLHRRRASVVVGSTVALPVLRIDGGLAVSPAVARATRVTEERWAFVAARPDDERIVAIDADGLPVGGVRWPLEP